MVSGVLIRSARIVDLEGSTRPGPLAEEPVDVRLEGDRVTEVAPRLDANGDEVYDAQGRWLMPGLWDHHVHLAQWTLASQRLDLSWVTSAEQALQVVADRLQELPDVPVVGWGHRLARWPRTPRVEELDAVSGMRPVVLIGGDGHHAWMNTVALRGLGLPERDGVVAEAEWFATYPRLASVVGADGTSPDAYLHTMRQAAARGIVGLVDLEFDQSVDDWPQRSEAGCVLLRVRVGAYASTMDAYVAAGLRTGTPMPGCGPMITMGPLKVISDGSMNTRTAWCRTPYLDTGATGAPNLDTTQLTELATLARQHGLEVAIHTIGDAAAESALTAFEDSGATGSIEHAQLISREDSRRMARLGIRASVQPAHLIDDRDVASGTWADRTGRMFAYRWLLDDGVQTVMGSDAPVSPLDPWLAASAAVHRGALVDEAWHPELAITAREALACSTDGHGSVREGSLADLILLDGDPLAFADGFEAGKVLREMTVSATWIDGHLVHSA